MRNMKTPIIVFIAIVSVLASCRSTRAITLVNPGFETGDLTGWTSFGINHFVESGHSPYAGSYSLKLFQSFAGANNYAGVYQEVGINGGNLYRYAGFLRNGNGGGDYLQSGNSAFLKIEWYNAGGYIGEYEYTAGGIDSNTAQDDQWLHSTFDIYAPSNATIARVIAMHAYQGSGTEGGSSWFDNLSLEHIVPEPATFSIYGLGAILAFLIRRRLQS